MPNCAKCGSPIGDNYNDRFCRKCGAPVNAALSLSNVSEEQKKAAFSNGALIGIGSSLLLVGLFIAFTLNGIYQQQIRYLASSNINIYALGLDNMVFLISFGVLLAIFGAYTLILGCLSQFSTKARIALGLKNGYTNAGNRILNVGILAVGIFSANLIRNLYSPSSTGWYEPTLISIYTRWLDCTSNRRFFDQLCIPEESAAKSLSYRLIFYYT